MSSVIVGLSGKTPHTDIYNIGADDSLVEWEDIIKAHAWELWG